jgi:hypothetical protein
MLYFSCSGGPGAVSIKSVLGHVTPNLFFCFQWDLSHVVHSGVSGASNVHTLIFILGWEWYNLHKKCTGTHYAKLMFWHPVVSIGHLVHSRASGPRKVDALFFIVRWPDPFFHKK